MNGSHKGSGFERQICKQLSEWWSFGLEGGAREDIFWRSSQSGGRATQRAKSGKRTFGSYGDIAAVDPIGQDLLSVFTIELKRGRSHGCPNDLLDCRITGKPKPFESCLVQARDAAVRAGSKWWLLILRRDGKVANVFLPDRASLFFGRLAETPCSLWKIRLCNGDTLRFVGLRLDHFLERVTPKQVRGVAQGSHRV